jgi:hypothetical protein
MRSGACIRSVTAEFQSERNDPLFNGDFSSYFH